MLNLKQAAGKVGISEGLLILWVSTGKFTPSIESSLKEYRLYRHRGSRTGDLTQVRAKRLLVGIVLY